MPFGNALMQAKMNIGPRSFDNDAAFLGRQNALIPGVTGPTTQNPGIPRPGMPIQGFQIRNGQFLPPPGGFGTTFPAAFPQQQMIPQQYPMFQGGNLSMLAQRMAGQQEPMQQQPGLMSRFGPALQGGSQPLRGGRGFSIPGGPQTPMRYGGK